jgi:hypothetical protein
MMENVSIVIKSETMSLFKESMDNSPIGNVTDTLHKPIEKSTKTIFHQKEDAVDILNIIGKQYPFCVNFKSKLNDPL